MASFFNWNANWINTKAPGLSETGDEKTTYYVEDFNVVLILALFIAGTMSIVVLARRNIIQFIWECILDMVTRKSLIVLCRSPKEKRSSKSRRQKGQRKSTKTSPGLTVIESAAREEVLKKSQDNTRAIPKSKTIIWQSGNKRIFAKE